MDVDDERIYRARFHARSERVRVVGFEKRKQSIRVDVEFIDGAKAGRCENVPGSQLSGPRNTVQAFDELCTNWQRRQRPRRYLKRSPDGARCVHFLKMSLPRSGQYSAAADSRHIWTGEKTGDCQLITERYWRVLRAGLDTAEHCCWMLLTCGASLARGRHVRPSLFSPNVVLVLAESCRRGG
jgi:hypothetical protein